MTQAIGAVRWQLLQGSDEAEIEGVCSKPGGQAYGIVQRRHAKKAGPVFYPHGTMPRFVFTKECGQDVVLID